MEYAIQLLIPMLAGLCLGNWLTQQYHASAIWTLLLGLLGFTLGIGVLAKKALLNKSIPKMDISARSAASTIEKTNEKGQFIEKSTGIMPHEMDFLYQDYSHETDDQVYDFSDRDDEKKL